MDTVTPDEIRAIAEQARQPYRPVQGNCGDIIDRLSNLLIDEAGLPYRDRDVVELYGRRHVRVGPNGEEKHYIFEIDGRLVDGFEDGEAIWVDLSFDQFNHVNKEDDNTPIEVAYGSKDELDAVRIMPPNDPRRAEQYMSVGNLFSQ